MNNKITFDSKARTELTVEMFENAVSVGMKPFEILRVFNKTAKEMDEWVKENYGFSQFEFVFDIVRKRAIMDYYGMLMKLGTRGNVTALNIMDKVLRENAADNVTKIVFECNVEKESEEDRLNDDAERT